MDRYRIKVKGIVKHNDEFLLIQKWFDDRIDDPYQWSFLDTTMENGETPETTAIRYIHESTGMNAEYVTIPYTWTYSLGDNKYLGVAILCKVDSELVVLSEDICGYKWVKAEELEDYIDYQGIIDDMTRTGII